MDFKLFTSFVLTVFQMLHQVETMDSVNATDVSRLLTDKLTSYNTRIRPLWNQSRPIDVNVTMELVSIQGIDEVEERLTLSAFFVLIWQDEFMRWDPENYSGLTEVLVNQNDIWTPNLVLVNSVEKFKDIDDDWNIVRVNANGYTVHNPGDFFSVSCQIDATFYPWDVQYCYLGIVTWGYQRHEMKMVAHVDEIAVTYFIENGAWEFKSSIISIDDTLAYFTLVLRRKPTFVIVNVICPVLFMAVLNILVFIIPTESGERMSFSITVLLAIAVFLTIVGDNLPKTSTPMSLLSYFLISVLGMSVLIIFCTIGSLRLYHRGDEQKIGPVWRGLIKCLKCRCKKSGNNGGCSQKREINSGEFSRITDSPDVVIQDEPILYNGYGRNINPYHSNFILKSKGKADRSSLEINNADSDLRVMSDVEEETDMCTWKDVSVCFDKMAFVFFSISFVVSFSAFLLMIFVKKDD